MTTFLRHIMSILPLFITVGTASAQDRYWREIESAFQYGSSFEYVSPAMIGSEFVRVHLLYGQGIGRALARTNRARSDDAYRSLYEATEKIGGSYGSWLNMCSALEAHSPDFPLDVGRCLASEWSGKQEIFFEMSLYTEFSAATVQPVFYSEEEDKFRSVARVADNGYLLGENSTNAHGRCFAERDSISALKKSRSEMETLGANTQCGKPGTKAAYIWVSMKPEVFNNLQDGKMRFPSVGMNIKNSTGRSYLTFVRFLDLFDRIGDEL